MKSSLKVEERISVELTSIEGRWVGGEKWWGDGGQQEGFICHSSLIVNE